MADEIDDVLRKFALKLFYKVRIRWTKKDKAIIKKYLGNSLLVGKKWSKAKRLRTDGIGD